MKKERKKSRSLTAWAVIVAVVCVVPMLASCQKPLPTPEGKPLDRVQLMTATGELATVEYTVSKIIKEKTALGGKLAKSVCSSSATPICKRALTWLATTTAKHASTRRQWQSPSRCQK